MRFLVVWALVSACFKANIESDYKLARQIMSWCDIQL